MKNIIFMSPPASGKGTLSKILEETFNYKHLATGDFLRQEVENGNQVIKDLIENGHLVSDEIIMSIIKEKISNLKGQSFILDGCPRTLNQAYMINDIFKNLSIDNVIVIKLNLDIETAKNRILGRRICKCGKSYNIYYEKLSPKRQEICDNCGSYLYQRSDDTEEKIIVRFNEYEKNLKPLVDFYKEKNMIYEIDANCEVEEVVERLKGIIND